MQRNNAVLITALAGLAVFGTGCVESWQQARFERDVELVFLVPAGSGVSARSANGSITLTEASRDDVLVRAHIKATTQERADAVQIVGVGEGPWLEVSAIWPEVRQGNEGVSFVIDAPGGRAVRAGTGNGAVSVTGFAGGAEVETSNGAVRVESHDGPISAETSNGKITILGATGAVDADTSNGAVQVELAEAGTGPVQIDTSNGGVTLVVGPGFAGRIDADTSNGSVGVDGGVQSVSGSRKHKVVQVGASDAESAIETSNGSVDIQVKGDQ